MWSRAADILTRPWALVQAVVLVAWAALLTLGFALGTLDERRMHRIPRLNKLMSSALLVISALIWWRVGAVGTALESTALLLFIGMAFSLVGDVIMAQLLPLPGYVLLGMATFAGAHVLYSIAYLRLGSTLGLESLIAQGSAIAVSCASAMALWWKWVRSPRQPTSLNAASCAYTLVVSVMAGLAVGLALQEPAFVWLALGAWLFALSDLFLGHRLFQSGHFLLIGDLIWMLYVVGQLLIVSSTAIALRLVA